MSQALKIYCKDSKEFEHLYSMSFNHYWNIRYDSGEDLFGDISTKFFDSREYLDDTWEIEYEDFIDFMNTISNAMFHALIIGYYQRGEEWISYCCLPEQLNYSLLPVVKKTKEIPSLDYPSFFEFFEIKLTDRQKNKVEDVIK